MKKLYKILCAVAALASVSALITVSADVTDEQKRKADYLYMEAQTQQQLDNYELNYRLLQRAMELNPEETNAGNQFGLLNVLIAEDSATRMQGLIMMEDHYKAHPDDYYSALKLASVLSQLGMRDEAISVWDQLYSRYPLKDDVALNYAENLLNSHSLDDNKKAIPILDRLETAIGKSMALTVKKVNAYLSLSDTINAIKEINDYMDSAPKDIMGMLAAGDMRMLMEQPDSALYYYNKACETDSTNGMAYYKLAEFYRESGDSLAYDREIFHAIRMNSLEVDTKVELLRTYIVNLFSDSTQVPRIHSLFGELIEQHPHETAIHNLYASYLVSQNDYCKAAEQVSYVLDMDHGTANDWIGLIGLRMQCEDYEQALRDADRAESYFSDAPGLMWYKSIVELQLDKPQEALKSLKVALSQSDKVKDDETLSRMYTSAGDIFHKLNVPDSTYYYYDMALAIYPRNYNTLNNYAYFLACEGKDLDKALEMSGKAIAATPTNPTNLDTYAWVQFKMHNYATAKEYIDKAIELEEEPSAEIYHHAGDIYFFNGEPDEAVKFWEKALELEDGDKELLLKKIKNRAYFYE
ncbi:MAG: tetratricopeptide repeat protein [Muribaculaceae bacterium]|nr:tetratricopeptide repeat protein [Muribaculaceae bacterium]